MDDKKFVYRGLGCIAWTIAIMLILSLLGFLFLAFGDIFLTF